MASFPDGSGHGWNLAIGRSDGGNGLGCRPYPVEERRAPSRSERTSWDSARSNDSAIASPESATCQQQQQQLPTGYFSTPELRSTTALAAEGSPDGARSRSVSPQAGNGPDTRDCTDQGLGAAPYIAEASLQFPVMDGVHVIPGLVAVRQDGQVTLSLIARTQWFF